MYLKELIFMILMNVKQYFLKKRNNWRKISF